MVVRSHARVSSLTLKSIQYTDAGEYICTASNTIGQDSQSMYLEVQCEESLWKDLGGRAMESWDGRGKVQLGPNLHRASSAPFPWVPRSPPHTIPSLFTRCMSSVFPSAHRIARTAPTSTIPWHSPASGHTPLPVPGDSICRAP